MSIRIYYLRASAGIYRRSVSYKEQQQSDIVVAPNLNIEAPDPIKSETLESLPIGLQQKRDGSWKIVPGTPKVAIASRVVRGKDPDTNQEVSEIHYAIAVVNEEDLHNFSKRLGRKIAKGRLNMTPKIISGSAPTGHEITFRIMQDIASDDSNPRIACKLAQNWIDAASKHNFESYRKYQSLEEFAKTAQSKVHFPNLLKILRSLEDNDGSHIPSWDGKKILSELKKAFKIINHYDDIVDAKNDYDPIAGIKLLSLKQDSN